jgi:hypothetical protein
MRTIRSIIVRLGNLFRKRKLDQHLDEEMAAHLDLAVGENLQNGMSPAEARRQALWHFGGIQQGEENHRFAGNSVAGDPMIALRYE